MIKKLIRYSPLVLIAFLAGCHLYSHPKDLLATAANEAVPKLGIDAGFAAQSQAQKALLAKQIELVNTFALADRNATLARVALSETSLREDWYTRDLKRRVGEILSADVPLKDLVDASDDLEKARSDLETSRSELKEAGLPVSCGPGNARSLLKPSELEDAARQFLESARDTPTQPDLDEAFRILMAADQRFINDCKAFLQAQAVVEQKSKGEVSRISDEVREKERELDQEASLREKVKEEFHKLDTAAAGGGSPDKTPSELLRTTLNSIRAAAKQTGELAALFTSLGEVEERLSRIDDALVLLGGTLPEGKDATDAQKKIAVAVAGIFEIFDKVVAFEKAGHTLPRTDLVIMRGELAARRAGIQSAIARHRSELASLQSEHNALQEELNSYREVEQRLSQAQKYFALATAGTANAGKLVLDLSYIELSKTNAGSGKTGDMGRARALVKRAIVLQAYARQKSTAAVFEARLRRAAAVHDSAIAQAQANTAQWMAIIQPLIAQQAQYHAGGIKPEQIAALVFEAAKAAGLFAIAAGVN